MLALGIRYIEAFPLLSSRHCLPCLFTFYPRNMSALDHKYRQHRIAVRHIAEDDHLELTMRYPLSSSKSKYRIFNFRRPKNESLGKTLERMAFSLSSKLVSKQDKISAKKLKRKASPDSAEFPPENVAQPTNIPNFSSPSVRMVLECENGVKIPADIPNEKAWRESTKLFVDDDGFHVEVNVPRITEAKITTNILPEFPVDLSFFTEFANEEECIFIWLRQKTSGKMPEKLITESLIEGKQFPLSPALLEEVVREQLQMKGNWEVVSLDRDWVPSESDVGHMIGLVCIPRNGQRIGNPVTAFGKNPVSSPLPKPVPFVERQRVYTQRTGKDSFRVVSYNILADLYADQEESMKTLFPYCPPQFIRSDYRRQVMLKEVLGYNADVLCLQEVDSRVFDKYILPQMKRRGYDGFFKQKMGTVLEGVATFFRTDKFEAVERDDIGLTEALFSEECLKEISDKIQAKSKVKTIMDERKNPLQVTVLRNKDVPKRVLVIGNTHLWFRPQFPHIRMIQIATAVKHLEKVVSQLRNSDASVQVSVLLCGDFNSTSEWGVYRFLNNGVIPEDDREWTIFCQNDDETIQTCLSHTLHLYSACGLLPYTNFVPGFQAAIDWIYADKDNLETTSVIPLPSREDLEKYEAIPSCLFPSDHIAIGCDLRWKM